MNFPAEPRFVPFSFEMDMPRALKNDATPAIRSADYAYRGSQCHLVCRFQRRVQAQDRRLLLSTDHNRRLHPIPVNLQGPKEYPISRGLQGFEEAFREYGLPERIRTDNGVPFGTIALARLSALSVWFIRLGIYPEYIEPGCPQQNGRTSGCIGL